MPGLLQKSRHDVPHDIGEVLGVDDAGAPSSAITKFNIGDLESNTLMPTSLFDHRTRRRKAAFLRRGPARTGAGGETGTDRWAVIVPRGSASEASSRRSGRGLVPSNFGDRCHRLGSAPPPYESFVREGVRCRGHVQLGADHRGAVIAGPFRQRRWRRGGCIGRHHLGPAFMENDEYACFSSCGWGGPCRAVVCWRHGERI
jgi:hypothetical protein